MTLGFDIPEYCHRWAFYRRLLCQRRLICTLCLCNNTDMNQGL